MKTIEEIKGRCVIHEITGCWLFKGAVTRDGQARVWTFDYNKGAMACVPGKRAVWYATNQTPVTDGHVIYGTCPCQHCINPEHVKQGTKAEWGQHMADSGIYKNNPAKLLANRRIGAARSSVTPETYIEIISSPETGKAVAKRLGISQQTASKCRTGNMASMISLANPFAGLGAR
jgi:hypothetical protein